MPPLPLPPLTQPDEHEVRDNATFESVLWALSHPGELRDLPQPGVMTVALALIDRECRVHAPDHQQAIRATGAVSAPPSDAGHAIMTLTQDALADVARLPVGSQLHPERGATIITSARIGTGQHLRLQGPGIAGIRDIALGGIAPDFWHLRQMACAYPLGFELIVVDDARVLALPRSTRIEVL